MGLRLMATNARGFGFHVIRHPRLDYYARGLVLQTYSRLNKLIMVNTTVSACSKSCDDLKKRDNLNKSSRLVRVHRPTHHNRPAVHRGEKRLGRIAMRITAWNINFNTK